VQVNAYPSAAVIAFLEHYAFHAGANCTERARSTFSSIASKGFEGFVYEATGYSADPQPDLAAIVAQGTAQLQQLFPVLSGRVDDLQRQFSEVRAISEKASEVVAVVDDMAMRLASVEKDRADSIRVNQILGEINRLGECAVLNHKVKSWGEFYARCHRAAGVASLKSNDKITLTQAERALAKARQLAGGQSDA
jgi:hypothetical protein